MRYLFAAIAEVSVSIGRAFVIQVMAVMVLMFCPVASAGIFSDTLDEGVELYRQGEFKGALGKFQEYEVDNPENSAAKFNQGNSQYRLKRFRDAEKNFSRAIDGSGSAVDKSSAMYNLGSALYNEGRLGRAADVFKKVLEMNSDDNDARYNLELIKKQMASSKKADNSQNDKQDQKQKDGQKDGQKEKQGQEQKQEQAKDGQDQKQKDGSGKQENGKQQGNKQEQAQKKEQGRQGSQEQGENRDKQPEDQERAGVPSEKKDAENGKAPEGDISAINNGEKTGSADKAEGGSQKAVVTSGTLNPEDVKRLLRAVQEGRLVRPKGVRKKRLTKDW